MWEQNGWRELHNEMLHNFYHPPHITDVIKSRRMIRVGHAECIGQMRNTKFRVKKLRVDLGKIILKYAFKNRV